MMLAAPTATTAPTASAAVSPGTVAVAVPAVARNVSLEVAGADLAAQALQVGPAVPGQLEFYLLCFGSVFCVEYQIKTIRQFCRDPHRILVIDSNCGAMPQDTADKRAVCRHFNVPFLQLPAAAAPTSARNNNISVILGAKLNFVFRHAVLVRRPTFFAFIDQDFFFVKPLAVIPHLLRDGMYGDVMDCGSSPTTECVDDGRPWVLHPWLSFYRLDFVAAHHKDWRPDRVLGRQCDTGAANWLAFIKPKGLAKAPYWRRESIMRFHPAGLPAPTGRPGASTSQVQFNDHFVHLLNSAQPQCEMLRHKYSYGRGLLDGILMAAGIEMGPKNRYAVHGRGVRHAL
jgi:hypothetical protein